MPLSSNEKCWLNSPVNLKTWLLTLRQKITKLKKSQKNLQFRELNFLEKSAAFKLQRIKGTYPLPSWSKIWILKSIVVQIKDMPHFQNDRNFASVKFTHFWTYLHTPVLFHAIHNRIQSFLTQGPLAARRLRLCITSTSILLGPIKDVLSKKVHCCEDHNRIQSFQNSRFSARLCSKVEGKPQ